MFTGNRVRILKQICYSFIAYLFFCNSFLVSQVSDTLAKSKQKKINAIVGFKLLPHAYLPIVAVASNLGLEYQFKNKQTSFAYRNFYSSQHAAKRPASNYSQKSLIWMTNTNCFDIQHLIWNAKHTNFIKFGTGVYFEQYQNASDQFFHLSSAHYEGIHFSVYSKLKWVNIGFRQQIQLFYDFKRLDISVNEYDKFSLCIEIPIYIK